MKHAGESDFEEANMSGRGAPNDTFAQHFKGNGFLNVAAAEPGRPFAASVAFGPGRRKPAHT